MVGLTVGTSILLVTDFPNRHSVLGEGQWLSTMMATQGVGNGPAWDNSTLRPCMWNSTVSLLLFHVVLLALAGKLMLLSFHAFRGEKHLREDAVGIGGLPVHRRLLLLEYLIYNRHLDSLDSCICKGKGNVSEPCNGLQWLPMLWWKCGFAWPVGSRALLVLKLQPQE